MGRPKSKRRLKSGPLTKAERAEITKLVQQGRSLAEISELANRSKVTIQRHIASLGLTVRKAPASTVSKQPQSATDPIAILRAQLQGRPYWKSIVNQFADEELTQFILHWCNMMKQLGSDVTYTEEVEIKRYVTFTLLSDRAMVSRRSINERILDMTGQLDNEYLFPSEERDSDKVEHLTKQLKFERSYLKEVVEQYSLMNKQLNDIIKSLKATRDQRIAKVEKSGESWGNMIAAYEEEAIRERDGREAELMRMAKDKQLEKFGEPHVYVDGKTDVPILSAKTV